MPKPKASGNLAGTAVKIFLESITSEEEYQGLKVVRFFVFERIKARNLASNGYHGEPSP